MNERSARLIALAFLVTTFVVLPAGAQQRALRSKHEYKPVRKEFWEQVNRTIGANRSAAVLDMSPPTPASGPEMDEWKLAVAKALFATGNALHAQYLLTDVAMKAVGTRQGFEALRLIREVAKEEAIDETALEELAFDLDTKIDDPESRSMMGYFKARGLLKRGYVDWAEKALEEVSPGTTYGEELFYDRTLQMLSGGDAATAYGRFEALVKNPNTRRMTATLSRLALARLIFERRDYRASISTYTTIDLPTRERVRSLNELAWSYYYDRAYGKALGTIRAIKSEYFSQLLSPETFLVEMLIYRELCHFKTVKAIVKEFGEFYKPLFTAIEDRKPLENNPQILQMILQEGSVQKRAVAIQAIRLERREIEAASWASDTQKEELLRLGERKEKLIDAEITRIIRTRIDTLANWFLDLREQAWFLDYESSMRMIQLNEDQEEKYEPSKADKIKTSVLFWPVNNESWLDELFDYEVLVRDQCRQGIERRLEPSSSGRSR